MFAETRGLVVALDSCTAVLRLRIAETAEREAATLWSNRMDQCRNVALPIMPDSECAGGIRAAWAVAAGDLAEDAAPGCRP